MILSFTETINKNVPTGFKDKILTGKKIHTVRSDSENRWKQGKLIHFSTGIRTKNYNCFAMGEVEFVKNITLSIIEQNTSFLLADVFIDTKVESPSIFLKNDGLEEQFLNQFFLKQWYDKGYSVNSYCKKFKAKLIQWKPIEKTCMNLLV